jgi:predicted permease
MQKAMLAILISAQTIGQDVKYGLRQLWSNPGFAAVAVLTLALGIGVNTSIFSLLNALMLRPLAVPNSLGLFGIYRGDGRPWSYADFLDFQQRAGAFSGLAADTTTESALDVGDSSEVVLAEAVSYNYAVVLGVKAALGRWFAIEDERAGDFPAVLSYQTWRRRFGGDPRTIGKPVRLESQWYTVVGVAPKDFRGMAVPVLTEVWVPLVRYAQHNEFAARMVKSREGGKVLMFGRLKPGLTAAQAQAELNAVDTQLGRDYSRQETRERPLRVERARGTSDPGYRRLAAQLLTLLSTVAGLVLLISCANVSNLLLGRGVSRRREVSIRLALGASRGRICRQMLLESLLLSAMGAAAGLAAAEWTNRILERGLSSAPSPSAIGASLSLDERVIGFVLIASVLTTVLFGFIPALQASRPDLVPALKGNETFSRNRRLTLRNVSVVAQVTLSLVLLIMAGLFLRALRTASSIDPGFDPRPLLSARLYIAKPEFNQVTGVALYRRVVERARTLPGVRNATLSYTSPMLTMSECVLADEARGLPGAISAAADIIGLNYFATLGIPLIRGRDFTSSDNSSAAPVVIVTESLARRYWPGQDAVGKRLRVGDGCDKGQGALAEIVGVAKDAQYASLDTAVRPYVFYPFGQHFVGYVALVMWSEYNPAALTSALRKELHEVDSRLRIYGIETLPDQMDKSLWQTRWEATLLGAFGMLALLIASVGLYGVMAFATNRRTREFGIRMALGARRRDVLELVTGDALTITLAGVGLGLVASLASTRLLRGFLYGLSPTDIPTYAGSALAWLAVSLLASCVPAYRATRVDPSISLRDE